MRKHLCLCCCLLLTSALCAQQNSDAKPVSFTLKGALDYALTHSYAVRDATYAIREAERRKWEALSIGLPQIDASVGYQNRLKPPVQLVPAAFFGGKEGEFKEVTFGTAQSAVASASLSQLLFDGAYLVGLQSTRVYLELSKNAAEKTRKRIRQAVVNAYSQVLLAEETIQILQGNLEVLRKSFHQADQAVKNGLSAVESAEQLEINLRSMQNQLDKAERQRKIACERFNMTLGRDIELPVQLSQKIAQLAAESTQDLNPRPAFSLKDHIDYRIAQNEKLSRSLQLKYEKSKSLPRLSASLGYDERANSEDFSFFEHQQRWIGSSVLGLTLKIPLFSSLGRHARIERARVEVKVAENKLEKTEQQIRLNLQKAASDYRFALDQYQTTKQNLSLAERIEKKERSKFFEGISSSQELNSAQQQLYKTQEAYLQSLSELINNKAALDLARDTPIKE